MRNLMLIAATALALSGTMASAQLANTPSVSGTPPGVANTPPDNTNPAAGPPASELPIPPSAQSRHNVPNGPGSAGTSSNPALNSSPTANGDGIDPTKGVYAKD